MRRRHATFLVLLLFLLSAACAKDLVTGKTTLNYYDLKSEPRLGGEVLNAQLAALHKEGKKLDREADAEEYERLQKIVARLQRVSHVPDFPYEVHLADVDIVNAWCAPGGKMMVYAGLWKQKEGLVEKGNEDELAAVMAHEMAHANARHVTETISRNMTIVMAGTAAQTAISAGGSAQGADLFGQLFTDGMNIYVPSYSRKNEFEADRVGLLYMAKAGYDPRVAVELWKKAAKRKKDRTSIYASHPASGARAQALEQLLPEALELYRQATGEVIPEK